MSRTTCVIALVLLAAMPAAAQNTPSTAIAQQELDNLTQAQTTLHTAEQAGAASYAKSLYDEAMFNIQFAQQNWSAAKKTATFTKDSQPPVVTVLTASPTWNCTGPSSPARPRYASAFFSFSGSPSVRCSSPSGPTARENQYAE